MIWVSLALAIAQSTPTQDCADLQTQQAMNLCEGERYKRADASLNAQWKITLAAIRSQDRLFTEETTPTDDPARYSDVLLASQRAWLAHRDAECRLKVYPNLGGSIAPLVEMGCRADLTERRTAELRELAEDN